MNPDEELKVKIISSIKEINLIDETDINKLDDKIKTGQITEQDVLLFLENKIKRDLTKEKKN